jgi:coenzyme F420-dependent glucose-6-phosphate dehydrogenase
MSSHGPTLTPPSARSPHRLAQVGFWISSEEHGPNEMVRAAQQAEAAGFPYVQVSDHFHPWTDRQGHSPFVWSVIAGIAATTKALTVGTGVTCPIIRTHPAIVAQAVATSAVMLGGRFFLGVGTGENLNEHITGAKWPKLETRREMLEEAIDLMRLMFSGGERTFRGRFFTLEDARLYTLPEKAPPIYVASGGPKSAALAARAGDGLIATSPDHELIAAFDGAGGVGKPKYIEVPLCWGTDAGAARRLAHELWRIGALGGQLVQELRRPADFEAATDRITQVQATEHTPVGPDVEPYVDAVKKCVDAGFDHIGLHQIGPDQEGFLRFWEKELRPELEKLR